MNLLTPFKRKRKGPPQRDFLDKPEGIKKFEFSLRDFLEKNRAKWIVGIILICSMVFVVSQQGKKSKSPSIPAAVGDKRILMTASSMEQEIGQSIKSKPAKSIEKTVKRPAREKKKLESDMAVFVFEKDPQIKERVEIEKSEKTVLGLSSGTKIPALLQDRVFSFNVQAPVLAVLAKDFMTQEKTLIPKNSKFMGEAN
ncbi:hypothetical protein N9K06_01600, partial [Omnitrophica bacterium]|nr:hypothetical protein [Candidatus Omnitrophota bacterium]